MKLYVPARKEKKREKKASSRNCLLNLYDACRFGDPLSWKILAGEYVYRHWET